jgi:hypothetical protein
MSQRRIAAVLAAALVAGAAGRAEDSWDGVARVVAVGDVHGDFGQLVTVLTNAGLLDSKLKWAGGKAHLVQTGDRIDRGADSRKVMDLLMRLEREAVKAGGRVHCLLGNHEAMNMLGDLRYVTPAEFAAFAGPASKRVRDALWKRRSEDMRKGGGLPPTAEDRARFEAETPLGWVEHRQAFASDGRYGSWLRRQNAVIRIGDTLFLHGGISPKYADFSRADLDDRIRSELADPDPLTAVVSQDPEGPLWYRGLVQDDSSLARHVEALLRSHGVRRIVVGHTPTEGLVMPHFGGRVVAIDVGLSHVYGGPPAAFVQEDGRTFALHRGSRVPLPDCEGEPVLAYVRAVAGLEPDPSRFGALIERLQAALSGARPAP